MVLNIPRHLQHNSLINRRDTAQDRQLIIGFEEPEIYLHPNAISKMRDTIYGLAETGNNQIVCTIHSPE